MGSAATLGGFTAGGLAAGSAAVPRCDADGFALGYVIENGLVQSVTVGGIADPGCEGGTLRLTVVGAGGAQIGTGGPVTIPTDGDTAPNSMTISIAAQPAASAVTGLRIAVVGP